MSRHETKSQHVSDSFVQPFLRSDFDPADHLNNTLPVLSFSSTTSRPGTRTAAFVDLSTQLQTLLTQLNTNTTRLSNTLTQLTDEIIRSGSRLAYEVEVLRGETSSLSDALNNDLKPDLQLLSLPPAAAPIPSDQPQASSAAAADTPADAAQEPTTQQSEASTEPKSQPPQDPEFLSRLRTLTTVRERLDAVIKVFGAAMVWPVAPSELSLASSFISVSAPEDEGAEGREERARAFAETLRREITELLVGEISGVGGAAGGAEGVEAANARVEELRSVAGVWKGTAEEKARGKLVEALQKLVDDHVKALGRSSAATAPAGISRDGRKQGTATPSRGIDYRYGGLDAARVPGEGIGGYGFLQNLRNLKNDMYLE